MLVQCCVLKTQDVTKAWRFFFSFLKNLKENSLFTTFYVMNKYCCVVKTQNVNKAWRFFFSFLKKF
jgi:hypothetical protein